MEIHVGFDTPMQLPRLSISKENYSPETLLPRIEKTLCGRKALDALLVVSFHECCRAFESGEYSVV